MSVTSEPRTGRFATAEIDLDHLSETYRFRPLRPEGEARVRLALRGLDPAARILDIGGGTGAHSRVMRSDGFSPVVVDPSAAQRARAAALDLPVVGGVGQALPFADDSFAMAYYHLSLHYGDWRAALSETVRILRPGGKLWIWTFSRKYLETSFTGKWFPSVGLHDLARFPEIADVVAHLTASGVASIDTGTVIERVERSVASWEEVFRARFVSTLQLIDDHELETGIRRFRGEHPEPDEMITAPLEFASICGIVGD